MSWKRSCDINGETVVKGEKFYSVEIRVEEYTEDPEKGPSLTGSYSAEGSGDVCGECFNGKLFPILYAVIPQENWDVKRKKKRGRKKGSKNKKITTKKTTTKKKGKSTKPAAPEKPE
jgi:hypothetical protein